MRKRRYKGLLWICLCDLRKRFAFALLLRPEMIARQAVAQEFESLFRRIHNLEEIQIFLRDGSRIYHQLEVDQPVPVLASVDHHKDLLGQLLCLCQGKDLEKFVERPETTWENDECFRQISEPELPHEEIVEFEIQRWRDVRIRGLLKRQVNIQSDSLGLSLAGAEVGGLHNPGPSSGGDHKTASSRRDLSGPLAEQKGQTAGIFVIACHVDRRDSAFPVRGCFARTRQRPQLLFTARAAVKARRSEEHDRVLNLLPAKTRKRLRVLRQNAKNASVRAVQKSRILISQRGALGLAVTHCWFSLLASGYRRRLRSYTRTYERFTSL